MPRAVVWYSVFCVVHAAVNLVGCGLGLWFVIKNKELANEFISPATILAGGLFIAPASLFVAAGNVWLMSRPRTKKAWSMHLGNLAVGAATCVLAPLSLPLLFLWFRPDVRRWYGA